MENNSKRALASLSFLFVFFGERRKRKRERKKERVRRGRQRRGGGGDDGDDGDGDEAFRSTHATRRWRMGRRWTRPGRQRNASKKTLKNCKDGFANQTWHKTQLLCARLRFSQRARTTRARVCVHLSM